MVSTLNFSEDDMSENELNSAFSQKDMSADCSQTELVERLKNITERIEKLEKNYSKPNYENFIFNHKNLITDFQQKKQKIGHSKLRVIYGQKMKYSKNTTRQTLSE